MIASIQGKIIQINEDSIVVDVSGIGYLLYVTGFLSQTLRRGERVSLFTHLVVREDSLTLFGFLDQDEKSIFQLLIRVNGVGPRLAMETLSTHSPEVIQRAVLNKQDQVFAQVSGIGKKTAQKIILSLEDKIGYREEMITSPETVEINDEILEAMTALGYTIMEAQAAVQGIPDDAPMDLESRLTLALRYFS